VLAPPAVAVLRATGMIMIQVGVDAVAALHLLRAHAHDHTRAVGVVADDVLAGRLRFEPEDPS
jgi:hypothetical protein